MLRPSPLENVTFELFCDDITGWRLKARTPLSKEPYMYVQVTQNLEDLDDVAFESFCEDFSNGVRRVQASLKGIETLSEARLKSLGSTIRQCRNLTRLSLSFNKFEALNEIWFGRFVKDICQCENLQELRLGWTNLAPSLEKASEETPQVIAMRLSGIKRILNWCKKLQTLDLSGNNLSILKGMAFAELSAVLPHPALSTLDLSNTDFKLLEIPGLNALKALLGKFPKLQTLKLSKINLGALNLDEILQLGHGLSSCPELLELDLGENELGSLGQDELRALGKALSQCPNLRILNLANNNLGTMGAQRLRVFLNELSSCPKLTSFDLHGNHLKKDNLSSVEESTEPVVALGEFRSLQFINLEKNELGWSDEPRLQLIGELIGKCPALKALLLKENRLGSLDELRFRAFIAEFRESGSLEVLGLQANDLSNLKDGCVGFFATALKKFPDLQVLELQNNDLTALSEKSFKVLAEALGHYSRLKKLNFGLNSLGRLSLSSLQFFVDHALKKYADLVSLNLGSNALGSLNENQVAILCEALKVYQNLRSLDLGGNRLKDLSRTALQKIFAVMGQYSELEVLVLNWNGLASIAQRDTQLTEEPFITLSRSLAGYAKLRELELGHNDLGNLTDDNILVLFGAVGKCVNLAVLKLDNNQLCFGRIGQPIEPRLRAIAENLSYCRKLRTIHGRSNGFAQLEEASFRLFCHYVARAMNLQGIYFEYNMPENRVAYLNRLLAPNYLPGNKGQQFADLEQFPASNPERTVRVPSLEWLAAIHVAKLQKSGDYGPMVCPNTRLQEEIDRFHEKAAGKYTF